MKAGASVFMLASKTSCIGSVIVAMPNAFASSAASVLLPSDEYSDGIRTPDVSNPKGYYEFEPVKNLDKGGDVAWLADARGKAVKIISFLLTWLPESYDYKVIFMRRDLREAIASQNAMLAHRGETAGGADDEQLRRLYEDHLEKVARFISNRSCFSTLTVEYGSVVESPRDAARRIGEFLGGTLDVDRMAAVVDRALYRNRHPVEV